MLALGMPAAILGCIFGHKIVMLLFGYQYRDSVVIFRILVWLLPLQFLRYKYSASVRATEYQKWQSVPILISTISMLFIFLSLGYLGDLKLIYLAITAIGAEMILVTSYVFIFKNWVVGSNSLKDQVVTNKVQRNGRGEGEKNVWVLFRGEK